ncbi:MAG: hypothetical protein ACHQU0_00460 [Candidatus Paceibacteria bacterium]
MNRTYLIATIALVVMLVLGIGAYFLFFTGSPTVTVAPAGSASLPVAGQGTVGTGGSTTSTTSPNTPVNVPAVAGTRLVQITAGPVVAGESVVDMKAANASSSPQVAVSFVERQSGNVFSYLPSTQTLTRINNKTIPGIQSASWLPDASTAFVRYLSGSDFSTINTYALSATTSNGFFLPQNLTGVAVSGTNILTLTSGVNGSVGSLSRIDGTHAATIFTTPLTSVRLSFAGKNQYLVFTKPASNLTGDAFLVSSAGSFSRIAGPLDGLVALASPSGKKALVSYIQDGTMKMELVDTTTGTATILPVSTIADKCVWTSDDAAIYCGIPIDPPGASYPDDWYQGAVQFSDRIWKIDVTSRYAQFVLDFSTAKKGALDATALAIDPKSTTLVFVNKNDGSLWSYSL